MHLTGEVRAEIVQSSQFCDFHREDANLLDFPFGGFDGKEVVDPATRVGSIRQFSQRLEIQIPIVVEAAFPAGFLIESLHRQHAQQGQKGHATFGRVLR
jgi:hypothetical protein